MNQPSFSLPNVLFPPSSPFLRRAAADIVDDVDLAQAVVPPPLIDSLFFFPASRDSMDQMVFPPDSGPFFRRRSDSSAEGFSSHLPDVVYRRPFSPKVREKNI